MIKHFASLVILLIFMMVTITLHYLLFPEEKTIRSLQQITEFVNMAPLSLSIAYDESNYNTTYPEMQGLQRMDFIYEQ